MTLITYVYHAYSVLQAVHDACFYLSNGDCTLMKGLRIQDISRLCLRTAFAFSLQRGGAICRSLHGLIFIGLDNLFTFILCFFCDFGLHRGSGMFEVLSQKLF